ncbi:hypothetical protein CBS101457_003842 [Exobasidium rhododendri]|nr:hypothetical protein CBS101457_003842 [Exobasidium rhododendri]
MIGRLALNNAKRVAFKRNINSNAQGRQPAHFRPTGQPTFVKGKHDSEGSLVPVYIGVGTALIATVSVATLLYDSYKKKSTVSPGLRPDQYASFDVLSATKTTSPSVLSTVNDEHMYLRINAPLSSEVIREGKQSLGSSDLRILSVFLKEPSLQIERPYTPLYSDALDGLHPNTPIELLVKRYPDGELGKYAHRLDTTSRVELRGPTITWQGSQPDIFILIIGGTGITPAYQLLNTVFSKGSRASDISPRILPKFKILYGATKPSSFLLLPELAALKKDFPDHIEIQLQADQIDGSFQKDISWIDWVKGKQMTLEGLDLNVGRINEAALKSALESSEKDQDASRRILVCGPDNMVAHIAGSKQGQSQGKLGGILASLKCTEEEVFKL